jgi:hypothetical protein
MAKRDVLRIVFCGLVSLSPIQATQQSVEPTAGTFTISGRVINSRGEPPTDLTLMVGHDEDDGFSASGGPLNADGTFTARDLAPGRYVLEVGPASEPFEIPAGFEGGLAVVDIGTADVTNVLIRTHPSVSVRGHIRYEAIDPAAPRPTMIVLLPSLAVSGVGIGGNVQSVRVADDGTFELRSVFGPRVIRAGWMASDARPPWLPGAVLLDGRDVTNVPTEFERHPGAELEVVFTQHFTGLRGVALDVAGLPTGDAWIIVFSSDRAQWESWSTTTQIVRSNANGWFGLNAPPGKYLIAALPAETFRSTTEAQKDFGELARLAVPVQIVDGRIGGVTLTVASRMRGRRR